MLPEASRTDPKLCDRLSISLLITEKLPVGVDQPGLPEAIGETRLILLSISKYARCSDRLIITLVPGPMSQALMKPIVAWTRGTAVICWWLAQPAAKDAIKMLI